jgi:thioredoxin 1
MSKDGPVTPQDSVTLKTIVIVALALLAAIAEDRACPLAFNAKAFADAQKAGKPILVAIHASWCPT